MPRRSEILLLECLVDALQPGQRDFIMWDRDIPGFGVRVYPSGRKTYVIQTRKGGSPRRSTIGTHGTMTLAQARSRAAATIDALKQGRRPASAPGGRAITVAELAERYMSVHVAANCNRHTARIYRGTLDNHLLPAFGPKPLDAVDRSDVAEWHHRLRSTPRAANRALGLLSRMFSLAADWDLQSEPYNPCRNIRKYREQRRERFLTREEYQRLGAVLFEMERDGSAWRHSVAALRLLMLTGCRVSEILTLRWDDVDRKTGEIRLRSSKAGARMIPLTPMAARVLARLECIRLPGVPWLFVARTPGKRLASLTPDWHRIRVRAGLGDVRIHDLRHSFASRALAAGESLSMIGRLLGHADIDSTARYAHLAQDAERRAAARVGTSIGADILVAA